MLSRRLIRVKVIKSLYAHFSSCESSLIKSEKEYKNNLQKCYELYLLTFDLIVRVADYAERRIEIGLSKMRPTDADQNPNYKFVRNSVIEKIRSCEELYSELNRRKLSWNNQDQLIKELYTELIDTPFFKAYMSSDDVSFGADRKLVTDFFREQLEDNEQFETVTEEMSIFWSDDIGFALGHVIATINEIRTEDDSLKLYSMFQNDLDKEYAEVLYRKALVNSKEYFSCIESLAKNWDFERIALMDKIIMLAAITELTQFPTIPVKVTLDEFIEISKHYSTPGSSTFINGIIDQAIIKLTEEGKINKTGRGLIES